MEKYLETEQIEREDIIKLVERAAAFSLLLWLCAEAPGSGGNCWMV